MKSQLLFLACTLLSLCATAQNYKYGKITKEELQETKSNLHPEVNAVVLFRNYEVSYDYRDSKGLLKKIEVHERIKIYNANGYEWATKKVRTNNDAQEQEVFYIKGTTYNLVAGSIRKDKLNKDAVFENRISKFRVDNTFTMPNIQPGSVIEYVYTVTSPYYTIQDIDLQYRIPIQKEIVQLKIPEYFTYNRYNNPQAKLNFNYKQAVGEKKIKIRGRENLANDIYTNGSGGAFNRSTPNGVENTLVYEETTYTLDEVNIPPLKIENFVENIDNYRAKSLWELAVIKKPSGFPEYLATTWQDVAKTIYEDASFKKQLETTAYYENDFKTFIEGIIDGEKKIEAILALIKSKVKWNQYLGYMTDNGLEEAYKEGTGNIADINLMLISMLQYAGLEAYPVLVSTSDNGIPVYATRKGFNYVIAGVKLENDYLLLDASDPFSGINMLPQHAMNWQGRMIRPNGSSEWVALYPTYSSQQLFFIEASIENGILTAKVNERKRNHFAKEYRDAFAQTDVSSQISAITTTNENIVISNFETAGLTTTESTMSVSYTANSTSLVAEIAGDLYLSPMLFFGLDKNPFKSDTREYPIFFKFPQSKKYTISIKVPAGYKVRSLPTSTKIKLGDKVGAFTYIVKQTNENIQILAKFEISTPFLLAEDYSYLKELYSQRIAKEKEKIVFTKI
jgi:hypothetical protein